MPVSDTGPAARLVAAMKQFGLISEDDSGINITERDMDLVVMPMNGQAILELPKTSMSREVFEFRLGKDKKATLVFDGMPLSKADFDRLDKNLVLLREMLFDDETVERAEWCDPVLFQNLCRVRMP